MPQELKQVNGRWVVTGAQQSSDLVPVVRPRPAARPTPVAKPKGKPKPQRPWWSKLLNDAQYELAGRPRDAGRKALREARTTPGGLASVLAADTVLGIGGGAPRQFALGTVGATANALRMGHSVVQRVQGKKKADPNSGGFGSGLNQAVEAIYPLLKAKPPSQMSQDERNIDQLRSSVVLNVLLAPVSPSFGAARAATALGMGVRGGAAFAFNEALSTFLDDNTSGNIVNLINSFAFDAGDFNGVPLIRRTRPARGVVDAKGNWTGEIIPAEKGFNLPGAVNVGQDDMVDAALKSFLPNAAASLGLGVGVGAAATGFKNIRRNIRARRAVQQEAKHRARQEAMGVLQKDEADGLDFTPEVKQPPEPAPPPREQSFAEANAAMEERLGMGQAAPAEPAAAPTPAPPAEPAPIPSIENATTENFGKARDATTQPLPEGSLDEDVWSGVYDPSLPESTTISKVWEELSDTEINTVMSSPGTPVIERLNQVLEARQGIATPPPLDAGMVMAPIDKLATDYLDTVMGKLYGREPWQLRRLFDPDTNPDLWRRAQALSGVDEPSQLTKNDMVDTLQFYAAGEGGQIPIVNRMMGAQMLPTAEVEAAPKVFQYKDNVNADGEQLGNSLSGVERWDPNAEGILKVWRDANGEIGPAGQVYVGDGHNRLAAAKRLRIPSIRVEFLDSPTAAEARLQAAISNVSDGKGTVFDAAKIARELGITTAADLKKLGKPQASGFWRDGIAMGRLPEDVFTAAVNEQIPLRRAVIIGESGGNEETMRSAYRYLVQQGPENVKEGTLREMLAMAQRSPAASSADQPDLLTGTEWAQSFNQGMLAKADLASAVRQMLAKEKKLFGTVGRQAGQIERVGQVDAGAAKEISGEAGRALAIFDQLKYETGPVGDLLNEGATRIVGGELPSKVAQGIKNRLAASIQEAMGKEVTPATDVVQEDRFAAATRAADAPPAPVELSQAERDAAEAQALQEAIAAGQVRPPNSPLPELPEPAQVRLDEAADEPLETRGQGRFFHGAADEFTLEPGGEFGGDGMNIYGDGLYVTDDLMTAAKYRKKNAKRGAGGQSGVVYEVTEKTPVKLLDLDQPASREVLKALRDGSKYNEEWIETAIEEAGDGASLAEIMDEMRGWSREFDKPTHEVQESFWDFFTRLEKLGYGGLTHEGGRLAGGGRRLHQVRIYWNPAESVEIKKIDPYDSPLAPGSKQAQAMADEIRLAVEHKQADAALQFEQQQALRDAVDYESLTFDEKKDMGMIAGVDAERIASGQFRDGFRDEPAVGTGLDERAAYARQQRQQAEAAGDGVADSAAPAVRVEIPPNAAAKLTPSNERSAAELLLSWANNGVPRGEGPVKSIDDALALVRAKGQRLNTDRVPGLDLDAALNDQAMGRVTDATRAVKAAYQQFYGVAEVMPSAGPVRPIRPEPLRLTAPASQPELLLPQDLRKSSPRYGTNTITFQSDLDRAAYVLANDAAKPSKAAGKFRQVVQEAGLSLDDVVAHGQRVKAAVKQAAKGNPGQIELPAQPWRSNGPMVNPRLLDDLEDPTRGPSLERLLLDDVPPAEREQILKQLGNERLDGVWTLGEEGAANRLEKDIVAFVQRMTGGRTNADIADVVFVRTNNAGYGGGGISVPEQVGGVNADYIYNEEGAVLLIARLDNFLGELGLAEMAQTGAHEAIHFLQGRRLTQKQLEVLTSDEAISYFRAEAGKARKWGGADGLENIELMAWGSQRVIAARLLRDMESLYQKQGLKKAAAYVKEIRSTRLGEYAPPPTLIEKALEPLISLWERVKNYLLGVGFKRNIDLTAEQLQIIGRFTDAVAGDFKSLAKAIDPRPSVAAKAAMPPEDVRQLLDAAYTGQIGKQMYLRPGRMGDKALANYERRWDVLGVSPGDYDARALPPTKAGAQRVRQQIDAIDQSMNDIRRKAEQEGC